MGHWLPTHPFKEIELCVVGTPVIRVESGKTPSGISEHKRIDELILANREYLQS